MDENNSIKPFQQSNTLSRVTHSIKITNKILVKHEHELIPFRKKDKWGFCNSEKKIVIECIYEHAKRFFDGVSAVRFNNKWGFINKKGDTVIPFNYEEAVSFNNNKSIVLFGGELYEINKNNEMQLIKKDQDGEWWFGDGIWQESIHFSYKKDRLRTGISRGALFSFYWDIALDGYNSFKRTEMNGMIAFCDKEKFGYKSVDNSFIIPAIYNDGYDFMDGLAYVNYKDNWGYIDKAGTKYWED